jgi:hypothetical protein
MTKDDEDDAPTYVMEDTKESLTKEEYDALVSGKDSKDGEFDATGNASKEEVKAPDPKQKEKIAEVGAGSKKRKVAKVIGDEQEGAGGEESKDAKESNAKVTKKPKKKAKAVKLTFGDDEG